MMELVFVIVVIGILGMIAIPKFAVTRDDATIVNAKSIVANIRTAINNEVQARVMRGDYTKIKDLGGTLNGYNSDIFDYFDGNTTGPRVLQYPIRSCKTNTSKGCWMRTQNNIYTYIFPTAISGQVDFNVSNNRFDCDGSDKCKYLER